MRLEKAHSMSASRRAFLQSAIAVAAGLAALPANFASEPIVRTGVPKFKYSLAAYSYRELFKKGTTLADFITDCAKYGLEGTELTSYYFPTDVSDASLRETAALCFRLGLDVSGTAIRNEFALPPGEKRDAELKQTKQWIDRAAVLGAPVIRIFAGHVQKGQTEDEAHKLMVAGMEECCDYAAQKGIYLALENHGGPTATAEGLLKLVRAVKSPWFGVNLDSGNFHSDNPYAELAAIAPYALNAQVKIVTSGPDKKKIPTDYPKIAKILRDVGYRGYVVLEYEEAGDPREECPKHLDELRKALGE
jgi:sugar phosphate isomerase/epimerase